MVERDEVLGLLVQRIGAVMGLEDQVGPDTRFDEDLHADSLDIVEIVESVERLLRDRGVTATLPDEDLVALETVGDAADRIFRAASA